MEFVVRAVDGLSPEALAPLAEESERSGWRSVRRLADDLRSGANRFDRPGERLFAATYGAAVVGVCGLNVDPYADEPKVGRIRRLFVLNAYRGRGVGATLVRMAVAAAAGRFRRLRVRTENAQAGRLYERLGFLPVFGMADCTHVLELAESAANPAAGGS